MHDGMPYDRTKVKVKVTSAWKPPKRSRPSVPHGLIIVNAVRNMLLLQYYIVKVRSSVYTLVTIFQIVIRSTRSARMAVGD